MFLWKSERPTACDHAVLVTTLLHHTNKLPVKLRPDHSWDSCSDEVCVGACVCACVCVGVCLCAYVCVVEGKGGTGGGTSTETAAPDVSSGHAQGSGMG